MGYKLTTPDKAFAEKLVKEINKDYPGVATVVDNCCVITDAHWEYCQQYVESNCKIK